MVTQSVRQLEEVFRAHQACVLKAAYRVTGSIADAEDVSQSVFLRLAGGTFDPGRISNMQSYLRRSAVNAALDLIRSRGDREVLPVETADEQESNDVEVDRIAFRLHARNGGTKITAERERVGAVMLQRPGVDVFQVVELSVIMREAMDVGEVHPLPARRLEDSQVGVVRQELVNFVGERVRQRMGRGGAERPLKTRSGESA